MKKRLPLAILVMAVLISLDQFVKYLIDSSFSVGELPGLRSLHLRLPHLPVL